VERCLVHRQTRDAGDLVEAIRDVGKYWIELVERPTVGDIV
jgi:hypothetical protein